MARFLSWYGRPGNPWLHSWMGHVHILWLIGSDSEVCTTSARFACLTSARLKNGCLDSKCQRFAVESDGELDPLIIAWQTGHGQLCLSPGSGSSASEATSKSRSSKSSSAARVVAASPCCCGTLHSVPKPRKPFCLPANFLLVGGLQLRRGPGVTRS